MNVSELREAFVALYGGSVGDVRVFAAPGRVNLIGEHTDYNGGYVFPVALQMRTAVAARLNGGSVIRIAATDLPDRVELDTDKLDSYRSLKWGNYQAGVAYMMQREGLEIPGCDLLYDDTVPHGSGLSSSAAIEVATALTLDTFIREKNGDFAPPDLKRLALLSQCAENEYCGVSCGVMDQFASAMGKEGNAIFLDCRDLSYQYVPLTLKGYRIVIANTNKKHSLAASKYNERRAECEAALEILKTSVPEVTCLRDISVKQFEDAKGLIDNEQVRMRAEHVVYECDRVLKAVKALTAGDLPTFGKLMTASHISLRDLYEVTGFELDTLVGEALKMDGCIGSRMTGAGFGGCTVSIVEEAKADAFISSVGESYRKRTGLSADFYTSLAADGAKELTR